MSDPVTVLLPVYNGKSYLAESIHSILNQYYAVFELLIIDDGSTDGSDELIASFHDPRITSIRHEKNQGLIGTLNHGLAESRYELIARHDQDDIAYPERLGCQVDFMNTNPTIGVCGSGAYLLEHTTRTSKILFPKDDVLIRWTMLFTNPIIHPSVMFRKSLVQQVGGYPTTKEASLTEDYALWWALLPSTKFHNIQQPLLDLRKHETNMTVLGADKHLQQSISLSKLQLEQFLGHHIPLELVQWIRQLPFSTHIRGRAKMLRELFRKFTSKNKLTYLEKFLVSVDAGKRMVKAIRDDLISV